MLIIELYQVFLSFQSILYMLDHTNFILKYFLKLLYWSLIIYKNKLVEILIIYIKLYDIQLYNLFYKIFKKIFNIIIL